MRLPICISKKFPGGGAQLLLGVLVKEIKSTLGKSLNISVPHCLPCRMKQIAPASWELEEKLWGRGCVHSCDGGVGHSAGDKLAIELEKENSWRLATEGRPRVPGTLCG